MKTKLILTLLFTTHFATAQSAFDWADFGLTNKLWSASGRTFLGTNYVDVRRYRDIGLEFYGAGANTNTNTITLTIQAGTWHTNFQTTPLITWTFTVPGTNEFRTHTNLTLPSHGYLRLYADTNAIGSDVTNCALHAILKGYIRN